MRKCSKYSKRKDLPLQKNVVIITRKLETYEYKHLCTKGKSKQQKRHYSCKTKNPSRLKSDQYIKLYIYTLNLRKYSITSPYFLNEKYQINTEKNNKLSITLLIRSADFGIVF